MKEYLAILVFIISVFGLNSCDRPVCNNENPIFDIENPESEKYKAELAEQLKNIDTSELSYWLKGYKNKNGVESLDFYIQGDELCAVINLTVTNWNGLEDIRKRRGIGRRGAEFKNLRFKIVKNPNATSFVYNSFDYLID
ncbi:hypothetical protein [Luteirhabdus pelagi]|uniref:hypothetical protein n=1 Tax=Luteirhabdus pelagi TaxID=2792783 RepID=UPI00193A04CA|nr:hypothetical protein [Luteirhabdus pelagi]